MSLNFGLVLFVRWVNDRYFTVFLRCLYERIKFFEVFGLELGVLGCLGEFFLSLRFFLRIFGF